MKVKDLKSIPQKFNDEDDVTVSVRLNGVWHIYSLAAVVRASSPGTLELITDKQVGIDDWWNKDNVDKES